MWMMATSHLALLAPGTLSLTAHGIVAVDVIRLEVRSGGLHAAGQIEKFNLPELCRMALPLDRDVPLRQRLAVDLDLRVEVRHVAPANLRRVVFENGEAFHHVLEMVGTKHFHFDAHPLIATIGRRGG